MGKKKIDQPTHGRNQDKEFPQKNRRIAATPARVVAKLVFWSLTFALLLFTLINTLYPQNPRLTAIKQQILINPFSPDGYAQLGREYIDAGSLPEARKELVHSQQLVQGNTKNAILGTSTTLIDDIQNKRAKLETELDFWKGVAQRLHNYRDAFLQMTSISFQLGDIEGAKTSLAKAVDLDPNNAISEKLQDFFSRGEPSPSPTLSPSKSQ